jgi:UDP-GlcNAc:undecaprenyl-phosphate GlcNAc-1-phosphate transferase
MALNWFVTYLWIVGVTNAFNLVDSMDNLAVGISGLGFAFFALASSASDQLSLTILSSILAGICVVLYFFNKSPAMLFLGDSGAQMMGFFLATVGILYTPLTNVQLSSWFVPIMLVAVPIFDTCLVTFSRLFHKKTIYKARLDHTYHRLTALGIHPGRAVAIMHITCLMINCLAFIAVNLPPFWANLVFVLVLMLGVAIFIFFELNKKIRNTLNQQLAEPVIKR